MDENLILPPVSVFRSKAGMILTGRLSGELTFLYYRFAPAADLSALATSLDCSIRTIFEIPPACASSFTPGFTRAVCILSKITGSTSSRWHVSPLFISRIFSVLTFQQEIIWLKFSIKPHLKCMFTASLFSVLKQ
jgi:hypothetical protein